MLLLSSFESIWFTFLTYIQLVILMGFMLASFFFPSMVVRGVVCKKNVAHRRMMSKVDKPRLLVLGGALEYQRVSNHLSSVDTLLQQVSFV